MAKIEITFTQYFYKRINRTIYLFDGNFKKEKKIMNFIKIIIGNGFTYAD